MAEAMASVTEDQLPPVEEEPARILDKIPEIPQAPAVKDTGKVDVAKDKKKKKSPESGGAKPKKKSKDVKHGGDGEIPLGGVAEKSAEVTLATATTGTNQVQEVLGTFESLERSLDKNSVLLSDKQKRERLESPLKTQKAAEGTAEKDTPGKCLEHPPEEYYAEFLDSRNKEKLAQLWPQHWGSFGDQPERDSLDGNLPSSFSVNPTAGLEIPQISSALVKKHFDELRKKSSKDKETEKEVKEKNKHNKSSKTDKNSDSLDFSKKTGKSVSDMKELWDDVEKEPFTHLWVTLSAMYGKIVVITMLAFCLTEVMDNSITPLTFQGVYMIYLYVGSILAIMCIYISLLIDQCPSLTKSRENLTSDDPESGSLSSFDTLKKAHISRSKTPRTSFYLRVGALVFGLATLVFNGLEIAMHATMNEKCVADIIFAHPILQALFTFLQMHFLFVNSEVLVEKFGMIARFGFIHLVATNISIWIRMIVWESANEWLHYLHYQYHPVQSSSAGSPQTLQLKGYPSYLTGATDYTYFDDDVPAASNNLDTISAGSGVCNSTYSLVSEAHIQSMVSMYECFNNNSLGRIWTSSMPYLFPFLVEYKLKLELHFSLIAAAVAYIMWRSVGKAKKKSIFHKLHLKSSNTLDTLDTRRSKGHWRVDCQSASKGLFMGLLCLVAGIIVLIIFFVMKDSAEFRPQLFWICTGTQSAVMALAALASALGFVQLPKLTLSNQKQLNLDVLLSNVTTYGVYIFAVFGLIVGGANIMDTKHLGVFISSALLLTQVTLQSMFIAEASKRVCSSRYQMLFKPGRQIVTFMLFANITLWLLDTFMTHNWMTQELQFSFYGFLAWGIISRISLPLVVFYRFHSAVVLIEIWKNTYRTKEI